MPWRKIQQKRLPTVKIVKIAPKQRVVSRAHNLIKAGKSDILDKNSTQNAACDEGNVNKENAKGSAENNVKNKDFKNCNL